VLRRRYGVLSSLHRAERRLAGGYVGSVRRAWIRVDHALARIGLLGECGRRYLKSGVRVALFAQQRSLLFAKPV
jgi:hypothetical protein